ncbi:MAG TPA: hypothetical protein DEV72_06480, partial [Ktedonobacter sp.]|nr:hypothetical protein [Ktedonobacter sp.]
VNLLNSNVSDTPETLETLETLETVNLLNSNVSDTPETGEAPGQTPSTPPLDLASITKKSVSSSLDPTAELTCTGKACPCPVGL